MSSNSLHFGFSIPRWWMRKSNFISKSLNRMMRIQDRIECCTIIMDLGTNYINCISAEPHFRSFSPPKKKSHKKKKWVFNQTQCDLIRQILGRRPYIFRHLVSSRCAAIATACIYVCKCTSQSCSIYISIHWNLWSQKQYHKHAEVSIKIPKAKYMCFVRCWKNPQHIYSHTSPNYKE